MVTWREAQLSWWPPNWVAGNEESSIKVSGVERFYDSKGVCKCVPVSGGDGNNSVKKKELIVLSWDKQRTPEMFP